MTAYEIRRDPEEIWGYYLYIDGLTKGHFIFKSLAERHVKRLKKKENDR